MANNTAKIVMIRSIRTNTNNMSVNVHTWIQSNIITDNKLTTIIPKDWIFDVPKIQFARSIQFIF